MKKSYGGKRIAPIVKTNCLSWIPAIANAMHADYALRTKQSPLKDN